MMTMKPWFNSIRELNDMVEEEDLTMEATVSAQAILDAREELGPQRLVLIELHTETRGAQFVAMPVHHRHGQGCGRA